MTTNKYEYKINYFKGFIVDGAVTIEAHIRVHKVAGLRSVIFNFFELYESPSQNRNTH